MTDADVRYVIRFTDGTYYCKNGPAWRCVFCEWEATRFLDATAAMNGAGHALGDGGSGYSLVPVFWHPHGPFRVEGLCVADVLDPGSSALVWRPCHHPTAKPRAWRVVDRHGHGQAIYDNRTSANEAVGLLNDPPLNPAEVT